MKKNFLIEFIYISSRKLLSLSSVVFFLVFKECEIFKKILSRFFNFKKTKPFAFIIFLLFSEIDSRFDILRQLVKISKFEVQKNPFLINYPFSFFKLKNFEYRKNKNGITKNDFENLFTFLLKFIGSKKNKNKKN